MSLPVALKSRLKLPLIAAPMFLVSGPALVKAACRAGVIGSFPLEERAEMVEADGKIRVTCEYCSRVYEVEPETVDG